MNGLFNRRWIDFETANHVVNTNIGENLRRAIGLLGLDAHFVPSNFLVMLLAKDCDHVEGGAPGEPSRDEFDRLRTGTSGTVVEQEKMFVTRLSNELPSLAGRLSQLNFRGNHMSLHRRPF